MKKLFSLMAAVLFAGSMMAEPTLIKFEEPQAATAVAGSTYGDEGYGFTLVIPAESDKASIDANSCTFGVSAEETVSFDHRLKTGGASSKAGRIFTLNIPEEGPLTIYARTAKTNATNRNFVIRNGSDTIVNHICLDTDTVEGASSKIFLPVFVENVPAGTYEISYPVEGINFYGFEMVLEETDNTVVEDPVFDVDAGSYYDPQTIHLSCATPDSVFFYTTDGTEPTRNSNLYYPQYGIYVGESATIKAIAFKSDLSDSSDVVTKDYQIAITYNSFDSLVVKAGAPAGQKVVVNFENVVIDSIYVSSGGKRNGIYLTAAGRMVEIYCYGVPAEWEVGGTISGVVKGEWKEWLGTWEVCPGSWDGITYQATLTFEVEAGTTTFTVTPSDLGVEYYISVIPAVNEDDVPYTKEVLVALIDGIIDDMGAGLEYFSGVQTQSYEEDWYVDEPGDYIIIVCGINATHDARTSDVIITPFTFSPTTAVEDVKDVKATKVLVNGQVVIIRNGVRYNVAGQLVK